VLTFLAYYPIPKNLQWGCALALLLLSLFYFPSVSVLFLLLALLALQAIYQHKGRSIPWLKPALIVGSWLLLLHGCLFVFRNSVSSNFTVLLSDFVLFLFLVLVSDWQDVEEDQSNDLKTILNAMSITSGMYLCISVMLIRFLVEPQGYILMSFLLSTVVLSALHTSSLAPFRPSAWLDVLLIADVLFYFSTLVVPDAFSSIHYGIPPIHSLAPALTFGYACDI
jgi:4-hydroxybenzoate polyprenyltransferase